MVLNDALRGDNLAEALRIFDLGTSGADLGRYERSGHEVAGGQVEGRGQGVSHIPETLRPACAAESWAMRAGIRGFGNSGIREFGSSRVREFGASGMDPLKRRLLLR
eukprot:scaffold1299_cov246-Pinguiococcus_pyrenoidosus.AAC.18